MGKFWRSEAILECDLVEKPNPQENQPWWKGHEEFHRDASTLFSDWIANFNNAARAGGFEVKSECIPGASPFEHYASYKIRDDSEYYATRPFHVNFKLVVHPSSMEIEDLKKLELRFRRITFEGMEFTGEDRMIAYSKQFFGVEAWCKSIQRHKITGRKASKPWDSDPNPSWHKYMFTSTNENKQ